MGLRSTRGAALGPKSFENARTGNCSGTVCPGGESPAQIGERADRVVERVRVVTGNVLPFSSGHFIRVLPARWLALSLGSAGRYFVLSPARLSALSYEHNLSQPMIRLWNDDHHVAA